AIRPTSSTRPRRSTGCSAPTLGACRWSSDWAPLIPARPTRWSRSSCTCSSPAGWWTAPCTGRSSSTCGGSGCSRRTSTRRSTPASSCITTTWGTTRPTSRSWTAPRTWRTCSLVGLWRRRHARVPDVATAQRFSDAVLLETQAKWGARLASATGGAPWRFIPRLPPRPVRASRIGIVPHNLEHLMMRATVLMVLVGMFLVAPHAVAQQKIVTGQITSEHGMPLPGVSIVVTGTIASTSSLPGASTSITIRGVSSISSSNQPLIIVDGLPMDNRTLNTGVLASDLSSNTAFSNRGVDFTNRAADLNPEDIETLTVLKGAEASALYGIDAANGAILITTKRGKAGGGWQYSNSFRIEATRAKPELQRVYGPSTLIGGGLASFNFFGAPYPAGTRFYDNIGGFLTAGTTEIHNTSFSGASPDNTVNYRLATSIDDQSGVVPNSGYDRVNVTGASQAQIKPWLSTDLSMAYTYSNNDQVYKGEIGPLIGLMLWPQNDNAQDYLTPSGLRRRLTSLTAAAEVDNPYYNVAKNAINSKESRIIANVGIVIAPFSWGNLKSNIGTDTYTNQNLLLRNPESEAGNASGGILDQADLITRNINAQTLLSFNRHALTHSISISGVLGNAIGDYKSTADAAVGTSFLDPNFVSMNNTAARLPRTTTERRRLVSFFGQAVLD